jgi:hypothetical protein
MRTVTYSDPQVVQSLQENFVPVQVDFENAAQLVDQFQVIWTPSLNVVDARGRRVYSVEGFLPPEHFRAMLQVARGQALLRGKTFQQAADVFQEAADGFPGSPYAAEARYYFGVASYLVAHQVDALKNAWGRLRQAFPDSEWATRADIF